MLGGRRRDEDWERERERVRSAAGAGGTWWIEWVPPASVEAMRACVERGPLRV